MNDAHADTNPYEAPQADLKSAEHVPTFAPGKTIRAQVVFTHEYLSAGLDRFQRQHPHSVRNRRAFRALAALFLLLGTICLAAAEWIAAAISLGIVALIIVPLRWRYPGICKQHAASPFKDEALTITMADEGFHATSALQDSFLKWKVFSRGVEFDDGVLLLQGETMFNWIPYSALDDSQDALVLADFVKGKIAASQQARTTSGAPEA